MTEKRIKTILQFIGEFLVIWYGMGTPIPKSVEEGIKLAVAVLAVAYTAWKNHDLTPEACEGTGHTRQQKLINKGVCVDIPAEAMEGVGILEDGDEDE